MSEHGDEWFSGLVWRDLNGDLASLTAESEAVVFSDHFFPAAIQRRDGLQTVPHIDTNWDTKGILGVSLRNLLRIRLG